MDKNFESLILEAPFPLCEKVRKELQMQFELVWLYLYWKNKEKGIGSLTASNSVGKKLDKDELQKINAYAKHYYGKIKKST